MQVAELPHESLESVDILFLKIVVSALQVPRTEGRTCTQWLSTSGSSIPLGFLWKHFGNAVDVSRSA